MIAAMSRCPPIARPSPSAPRSDRKASAARFRRVLLALASGSIAAVLAVGVWSPSPVQAAAEPARSEAASARPLRLVSLNPSLSAIAVRLGGQAHLVGIDDYSARIVPALASLPRVGGLFDPSLEAVLALRPDRVLLVAGLEQETHAASLRRLGLTVEVFENERYEQVMDNIARIGRLVGRPAEATARIERIRATRAAVERVVAGRPRPRALIVIDRSPLYLVGAGTFLDELLVAVGAENLGSRIAPGYPRASLEWLVAAAPELLLDLSPQSEASEALAFWSRWPSLPAVKSGRVLTLDATRISLPGPELDQALLDLAVAVHGRAIESELRRERAIPSAADERGKIR